MPSTNTHDDIYDMDDDDEYMVYADNDTLNDDNKKKNTGDGDTLLLLMSNAPPTTTTTTTTPSHKKKKKRKEYTFDQALDSIGMGTFQIILLLACGGGWFFDGVQLGIVPFILPNLSKEWNLSHLQSGVVGSSIFAGMMIGAYFGGLFSDKFGRRFIFLAGTMATAVLGVASAFAADFWSFFVLRTLTGIGLGATVPTDFALFMEFVPSHYRGMFMGFMNIFWSVGGMFICIMAHFVLNGMDISVGWRWLVAVGAVPGFLIFAIKLLVPESPRYHMVNNQSNKVYSTLQRIASINKVKLPEGKLVFENVEQQPKWSTWMRIATLFSPSMIQTTLLLFFIWSMLSYGNWGMAFLLPIVFASLDQENMYRQSLLVITVGIAGYAVTAAIMDRFSRRHLLAVSFIVSGILTACVGFTSTTTGILVLAMIVNFFATLPWATLYTYTPEVFPTVIRATAVGTCSAFTRLSGTLTPVISELLLQKGMPFPFISFGIALVVGGIACLLLPIETQGQALRDTLNEKPQYSKLAQDEHRQPLMHSDDYVENFVDTFVP